MTDTETTHRTALVTGASAGIGEAFARQLAQRGYELVITARREERLQALAEELERAGTRTRVLPADLSDPAAPQALCEELQTRGLQIDALVNNAGYGLNGAYHKTSWKQQGDFLQVMVVAVCELTHRLLPSMVERGFGRVVNVASVAGLVPGTAGATLYGAAKSHMIKFSEAVALELQGTGVHVTAVCPGYTYSEFHDVNGSRERVSRLPGLMWMDANTVVRQSLDAAERGDMVYINGAVNRAIASAAKYVPAGLTRGAMRRMATRLRAVD